MNNEIDRDPRLFCIVVQTNITEEIFINATTITWGTRCYEFIIVKSTDLQTSDNDAKSTNKPQYANVWSKILTEIRLSKILNEYIANKDSLIIVPARTFIFHDKVKSFLKKSIKNYQLPIFIIYKLQDTNAYILNGRALLLLHSTKLMDSCLDRTYPGARETHLWKCVKNELKDFKGNVPCKNNDCFIQHYHDSLTIAAIKNGSCLLNNTSTNNCKSSVLLYPAIAKDMLTLEFFKYRLKLQ